MFSKIFVFMTVAAVAVNAQSSSGTASAPDPSSSVLGGISPCILACVIPAATQNNCSFSDPTCVCASAQFQADATQCLTAHCTPADLQAAQALQSSQCSAASITPTGSATGVNTVPFSLASGATSAPASATSPPATTPTAPAGSGTSPSTAAPANTSKAGALSLVANSGVGAVFGAMLAAVLAL
ncbi:hypothetical protein GALMADRAFT_258588 [Galerina marginata CBS 339.88]|uniref:CFEM domain-containing protein n=1 Tax=Galerina marginata (strain CBS 339.88) TaxID=685588 RepID=A0A067SB44_GALM3|nr:hypothetical protein GALMADRAFT_258588 [Galerina marginata CBS 339.88]